MIIFHEGLPRSGKSYEACINQIIPALKKGRKVYTNIDGVNRVQFAQVAELPIETVIELLHTIDKEHVKDVQNHVPNDSLVLLDELQDYFPAGKSTLDPGITEFVTQHGHRGIDIIAMGQDHRDCHMLWKRRIDQLFTFVKRDAVGMPNKYTWTAHKRQGDKFIKVRSGVGEYDPKYFGLYKSHVEGVTSIDAHKDDRINILKSSVFTFWLPVFVVVLAVAIYYLYGFFHSTSMVKTPQTVQLKPETIAALSPPVIETKPLAAPSPKQTKAVEYGTYVENYLDNYRPRLAGLVISTDKKRMIAKIDFYEGQRIIETLGTTEFTEFGYTVEQKSFGLLISKGGKSYPITSWPLDIQRNVSEMQKPALGHEL